MRIRHLSFLGVRGLDGLRQDLPRTSDTDLIVVHGGYSSGKTSFLDAIAAAKAGIIGLTLSAAATYAPMNLRVNAVAPGLTETPLTAALTGNETSRKFSESMHALGRLGQPNDIARAIVFLLDPINNWITGQVWAVDGGLSSVRPKMKV